MKFTVVKFNGKLHQHSSRSTAILRFLSITKEPQYKGTMLYNVCSVTVIGKEKVHKKCWHPEYEKHWRLQLLLRKITLPNIDYLFTTLLLVAATLLNLTLQVFSSGKVGSLIITILLPPAVCFPEVVPLLVHQELTTTK